MVVYYYFHKHFTTSWLSPLSLSTYLPSPNLSSNLWVQLLYLKFGLTYFTCKVFFLYVLNFIMLAILKKLNKLRIKSQYT
jgi:hypothetical protein